MANDLYRTYTVAYTYKTNPYLRLVSPMISEVFQSGVCKYWESEVSETKTKKKEDNWVKICSWAMQYIRVIDGRH